MTTLIKLGTVLAILVVIAVVTIAAKPDPTKIPDVVLCDHNAEEQQALRSGGEPLCHHNSGPDGIYVFAPIEYSGDELQNVYHILYIRNESFEVVEPCTWHSPVKFPGEGHWNTLNPPGEWNHFLPVNEGRDFYILYPCEAGIYYLDYTTEYRDPATGEDSDRQSALRRWTIPER